MVGVAVAVGARGVITVVVEPASLDAPELRLEGETFHHLFRAARATRGDAVRAVDGRGRARTGVVTVVERRAAVVVLGADAPSLEPWVRLELLVAPPRPSRASWLVEKGTELGVHAFRFLACGRGQRSVDAGGLERLRRVARAAVEQCGRAWIPELTAGHPFEQTLERYPGAVTCVLDPSAREGPRLLSAGPARDVVVAVGPEGGFTPAELQAAYRLGAAPMRLVPCMLRVETAALAAASWVLLHGESGRAGEATGAHAAPASVSLTGPANRASMRDSKEL